MARLNRYRASQGLATPGTPSVREISYTGRALEGFGAALTSAANSIGSQLEAKQNELNARTSRRQKMEADAAYKQWKAGANNALSDAAYNMNEGGTGFASGYMDTSFNPSAQDFLTNLEKITDDPEILAYYQGLVDTDRELFTGTATETERKEMVRFQTGHIESVLEDGAGMILSDPDSFDEVSGALKGLIDSSNLPGPARAELGQAVDRALSEAFVEAYADQPLVLFDKLGGDWGELKPEAQAELMTSALADIPAPPASALEPDPSKPGYGAPKSATTTGWVSNVETSQLGMIGGNQNGRAVQSGGYGSGREHIKQGKAGEDYGDYSMAFRVVSFEKMPGGIKVGERNGRAVYAAPNYLTDENGDIITHVSATRAKELARETGSLFMTEAEYRELERQTQGADFKYQPGATDTPGRGDGKASSDAFRANAGDAWGTGVRGMKEMFISMGSPVEPTQVMRPGSDPNAGMAFNIVRVGRHNMNLADAIRIGRKIDSGAPETDDPRVWATYLTNDKLSDAYANAFFKEALEGNGGDRAAAYVQFFLGDERAAAWVEGGKNAGDLPRGVSNAMGDIARTGPRGVMSPKAMQPTDVTFSAGYNADGSSIPLPLEEYDDVDPRLVDIVQKSFSSLGISDIRINDAERESVGNGASRSQHLVHKYPGQSLGAFDIDVSGYSQAEQLKIIETLSANGAKGIGVYGNTIHVDVRAGGPQSWGPDYSSASIPSWARPTIQNHMNGVYARQGPQVGGSGAQWTGAKAVVANAFEQAGFDPIMGLAFASIESGVNPSAQGGSTYWGLFQNDKNAMAAAGLDWSSAEDSTAYALDNMRKTIPYFKDKVGRAPKPHEIYLLHQQGIAGGTGLVRYPDLPAWQAIQMQAPSLSEARAKEHIRANGGNPDAPASEFTGMWERKFNQHYAKFSGGSWADQAQGKGYQAGPDPRIAGLSGTQRANLLSDARDAINGKAMTLTDQRAVAKGVLDQEISLIGQTGSFSDGFDLEETLAPLTIGDQRKYRDKAELASYAYQVDQQLPEMSAAEMDELLTAIEDPDRGPISPLTQEKDSLLMAAMDEEIKRREADPAAEAINFPDVAEAWSAIGTVAGGIGTSFSILDAMSDPNAAEKLAALNNSVSTYIERALATQVQIYGLNPTQTQHLPVSTLRQISRDLNVVLSAPNRSREQRTNDIALFVAQAQQLFGEYADEIIVEAIDVMKGAPEAVEGSAFKMLYDSAQNGGNRFVDRQAEIAFSNMPPSRREMQGPPVADPDEIPMPAAPIPDAADLPEPAPPTAQDILEDRELWAAYSSRINGWLDSGMSEAEVVDRMRADGFDDTVIDRVLSMKARS